MNAVVLKYIVRSSLVDLNHGIFNYFDAMAVNDVVAELFIDSCNPKKSNVGSEFATVPIGAVINLAVLPKVPGGKFEFFTSPMDPVGFV